jgi:hypothetical protein
MNGHHQTGIGWRVRTYDDGRINIQLMLFVSGTTAAPPKRPNANTLEVSYND